MSQLYDPKMSISLDEIKQEGVEEDIKSNNIELILNQIKTESFEDGLDNIDPLKIEVTPFGIILNEIEGDIKEEDVIESKYPIGEPGCSTSNATSPGKIVPSAECAASSLSCSDDGSLKCEEAVMLTIKSEETDFELKIEEEPIYEANSCSVWTESSCQLKPVQISAEFSKNSKLPAEQLPKSTTSKAAQLSQCTFCEHKCKRRRNLKQHIITKHKSFDEVEVFQCPHCDYKAKIISSLKQHIINKHKSFDDVKVFQCPHCDYKAKISASLKKHIINKHKSWDEVEAHTCSFCPYRTRLKSELKTHIIQKHKKLNKKIVYVLRPKVPPLCWFDIKKQQN